MIAKGLSFAGAFIYKFTEMNSGSILSGRPSLGAWVNYGLGSANRNLPSFVVMLDDRDPIGADDREGAVHAPGGQLIQATDQWVGVRNARIVLVIMAACFAAIFLGISFLSSSIGIVRVIEEPSAPSARTKRPRLRSAPHISSSVRNGTPVNSLQLSMPCVYWTEGTATLRHSIPEFAPHSMK